MPPTRSAGVAGQGGASPAVNVAYDALTRRLRGLQSPAHRVRACTSLELTLEWAEELGVRGLLQDFDTDESWLPGASPEEREMFEEAQRDAQHRTTQARDPSYRKKLNTMLHWLALFKQLYPSRVLFLPLHEQETHAAHAMHNSRTLIALRTFIERHGSLASGKQGQSTGEDAKQAVLSTLRAFRSREAGYDVCDPKFCLQMAAISQAARRLAGRSRPVSSKKAMRTTLLVNGSTFCV